MRGDDTRCSKGDACSIKNSYVVYKSSERRLVVVMSPGSAGLFLVSDAAIVSLFLDVFLSSLSQPVWMRETGRDLRIYASMAAGASAGAASAAAAAPL